ncbi:MAG: hypothetical protein CBC24_08245 [Candidatus Pelagibacter sp. TMED64]|nr:MAG: hypothetical protein CBC24_08245 [Candidatus Pelagibacter sp. TMED64]|tara:strand:- start:105 stop:539 length:435 start_codon:yes stop_codon:yes gene_type:complete
MAYYEIIPCENGVGEWEISNTHETFDTREEAEKQLAEYNKSLRYYIANIDERYGEFECKHSILIATHYKSIDKRFDEIVKDWYGIDLVEDDDNEGVYWNDDMTYQGGKIAEISKNTFEELKSNFFNIAFYDEELDHDPNQMELI